MVHRARNHIGTTMRVGGALAILLAFGCPDSSNPDGSDRQTDSGAGSDSSLILVIGGEGRVTVTPPGTTYDAADALATLNYPSQTTVTLAATPIDGWAFFRWQGGLEGNDNPATVVLNSDQNIVAMFVPEGLADIDGSSSQSAPAETWSGLFAADQLIKSETEGDCVGDAGGTISYVFKENTSRQVAVAFGPIPDLQWQQPAEGSFDVSLSNRYDTTDSQQSMKSRVTASQTISLITSSDGSVSEIFLDITPMDAGDGSGAASMDEWILPYEEQVYDVWISISIRPEEELSYSGDDGESLNNAWGSIRETDTADARAPIYTLDIDFVFPAQLVKRADGRHEIVGMSTETWTEDGYQVACDTYFPREITENRTFYMVRTP